MARKSNVSSTNDSEVGQHAIHTKFARKEKKRKRNDEEEDEVEAIVAAESGEQAPLTKEDDAPETISKKRKRGDAARSNENAGSSETTQRAEQGTPSEEPAADKGKKKKKSKGKDKQRVDVPIDPELAGGDVTPTASSGILAPNSVGYQHQPHPAMYSGAHYPPGNAPQHFMFPSPYTQNVPGSVAIPEALFQVLGLNVLGSNGEEITRALQSLDLTKITDVLRQLQVSGVGFGTALSPPSQTQEQRNGQTLNDAQGQEATAGPARSQSADPGQLQPTSDPSHPPSQHVGFPLPDEVNASQVPVPSALIMGQPLRNPPKVIKSGKVSMPSIAASENPEHAFLLANKWLGTDKLKKLAEKNGLVYKRGKFSSTEEAIIKNAIETYRATRGLTQEQLNQVIFAKSAKDKQSPFWSEITAQVPLRPLIAVYHYVRRAYHPMKRQGKWTPEEDEVVRQAVAELGPQWEAISTRVGRMASDCRDRWRNHLNNRETRRQGPWTKEEEEKLKKIVTELTIEQGKDPDNDVFWAIVEGRMGGIRGRQQCRIKWTDALSKTVKNGGSKPRWSQQDAYILVHKIASLNVRDDSEIDWKLLPDDDWNLWSAHSLQRRWLTLKKSVRGYEEMSHQDIMDILRLKKSNMPPPPAQPRKTRVTSEATVPLDIQTGDAEGGPMAGLGDLGAGSSTHVLDMRHTSRARPVEEQQEQVPVPTMHPANEQAGNEPLSSSSSSSSESDDDSDDSSDSD